MKLRKQIDENLKWDLEMFKTQEEIDSAFADLEYLTKEIPNFNGKFTNKDMFFKYFNSFKEKQLNVGKLSFYIGNSLNTDVTDVNLLKLNQKFNILYSKYQKATSFVKPQLDDLNIDYLNELLLDNRSKDLDNEIKEIIRNKPHKIDEKTSYVLSLVNNSFENSEEVFEILTNSELKFKDATDSRGKKYKVTESEYSYFLSNQDKTLRETAFNSIMNGYSEINKTLAELFIKNLKSNNDEVELFKFKNLLEFKLHDEEIPNIVYKNNIDNVNKNINILQNYIKIFREKSKIENFSYFDLFVNKKINKKISISNAKEIMLSALAPLGEEYLKLVTKKLNDKSIDYMPNLNKRGGAYCSNYYSAKTLILMNWTNDYNSLSTLCHEMGHCINAEYFNSTQPMEKAGITIFAAEIASTVNEILLNQYMLKNAKTNSEKEYYLKEFLNDVRSTIFRQTLFSEFEYFAHTTIENEQPLTYKELNEEYYNLNKKYYGKSCKLPKNLQYEWSRIPHFYSPYYVYCYSTGLITAISIANKILKDPKYVDNYLKFLKNGTNKPAVEILKEIGIDLTTNKPFEDAFNFIKEQLNIYKSLK